MTVREQAGLGGGGVPFLDRVVAGADLLPTADTPDLRGYVELALRGGFPEPALRLGESARRAWLEELRQISSRGTPSRSTGAGIRFACAAISRPTPSTRPASLTSARSSMRRRQPPDGPGLRAAAGQPPRRGGSARLDLEPPQAPGAHARAQPGRTRAGRGLLGLDTTLVLREGDLIGRLLDTFVVAQLRAEIAISATRPRLYHVRSSRVDSRSTCSRSLPAVASSDRDQGRRRPVTRCRPAPGDNA